MGDSILSLPVGSVSICIPVYNTVTYLRECLNSAIAQTRPADEILILDSCSDDGSWEIIQEFSERCPIIRAWQGPRGLYKSWNTLIREAKSEWIYILTSDDTMKADCLEQFLNASYEVPEASIIMCALEFIDEASRVLQGAWRRVPGVFLFEHWLDVPHLRSGPAEAQRVMHISTTIISITGALIRKQVYEDTGYFPEDAGPRADFLWYIKGTRISDVCYIPEVLATWRRHGQQITKAQQGFVPWFYDQNDDLRTFYAQDPDVCAALAWRETFVESYAKKVKRSWSWLRIRNKLRNGFYRCGLVKERGYFDRDLVRAVRKKLPLKDLKTI